jgi:protein-tyrosine phosphatase
MPRPRAGDWLEDEIAGWRRAGIDIVVSLLEHTEVAELDLLHEPALCRAAEIEFRSFPIRDRHVPTSLNDTKKFVADLALLLKNGRAVAIHCRAGIGRTSLIAGCVLLELGYESRDVFPLLSKARRLVVPDTQVQIEWLSRFDRHRKDAGPME